MYRTNLRDVPKVEGLARKDGWVDMQVQFLIDKKTAGADHVVGWTVLKPGARHERHRHHNCDEFFIVLKGHGHIYGEHGDEPSGEGDVVYSPRGCWHGFNNTSNEDVVLVWGWMGAGSIEDSGYEVDPESHGISRVFMLSIACSQHAPPSPCLACVAATPPAHAQAQTWPQRTVRFIVPLPPGSGMDLSARVVAEQLAQKWGQPVVVENRQGADGIPAVTAFLSARDNHTFLFSFGGIVTFNHLLHEKLPYDPADVVPIVPVIDNFLGVSVTAHAEGRTRSPSWSRPRRRSPASSTRPSRRACRSMRCWRCSGTPASRWPTFPTATSRRPIRTSTRAGCTSSAPACRRRSRITAPAPPSSCSSPTASARRRCRTCRPPRKPASPTSPSKASPASSAGATCRPRSASAWSPTSRAIVADPDFRARVLKVGTVPRPGTQEQFAAAIEEQRKQIAAIHAATAKPKP